MNGTYLGRIKFDVNSILHGDAPFQNRGMYAAGLVNISDFSSRQMNLAPMEQELFAKQKMLLVISDSQFFQSGVFRGPEYFISSIFFQKHGTDFETPGGF